MRLAPVLFTASLTSIALVVACTGGTGTIEQGGDNGDQYGTVTKDPTGPQIPPDFSSSGITTSSSTSGVSSTSGASSTSGISSTSGTVYTPQPDLKATDYNQSCTTDSNCQQVYEGPVCNPCLFSCQNAAIASSDYSKWSSDRTTRYVKCDPSTLSGGSCTTCNNTGGKRAYCDTRQNKCVFGVKPADGG